MAKDPTIMEGRGRDGVGCYGHEDDGDNGGHAGDNASTTLGSAALTPNQEDLWDTRSLYSSQLSEEDLLWTDWFGGTEEDAMFEEALTGKRPEGAKRGTASRQLGWGLGDTDEAEELTLTSDEMARRVLRRTAKGKRRECVGTSLFKPGSLSVSLWCDPEATSREIRAEFGCGAQNPTELFTGTAAALRSKSCGRAPVEYVLSHAGHLGLALCATTTKPIAYADFKRAVLAASAGGGSGSQLDQVADALAKLEASDVVYEGLFGVPLPRFIFRENRHGTVDLEQGEEGAGWRLPALAKAQEALGRATQGARKALIRCQREYLRVGSEFVFDFQRADGQGDPTFPPELDAFDLGRFAGFGGSLPREVSAALDGEEGAVDLLVVAPPDKYGKRSSIQLGTFGMAREGREILNAAVFSPKPQDLATGKNYPLLGLGYVSSGFVGLTWRQRLPRWRRALRRTGGRFKERVDALLGASGRGGGRARPGAGLSAGPEAPLDTLEVAHGECLAGMHYTKPNFECYDLRAGNPVPMLLHSVHTRVLASAGRKGRRCVYQLQ